MAMATTARPDTSTAYGPAATAAMRLAQTQQEMQQQLQDGIGSIDPLAKQPFTKASFPLKALMEAPLSKDDFYNTLQHSHLGRAYLAHFSENTLATVLKYTTLVGAAVLLDKYGWNRLGLHEVCFEGRRIEEHLKLGTEGLYTLPASTSNLVDQLTAAATAPAAGLASRPEQHSPLGFQRTAPGDQQAWLEEVEAQAMAESGAKRPLSNKFLPLTEKVTQTPPPAKAPYVTLEAPAHGLGRPATSFSAPPKRTVNHHRDIKGVYDVYPEWWWELDPTNEQIKNSLLMTSQKGRFLVRSAPLDSETLEGLPPVTTNSAQKKTLKKKTPADIPPHRKVQTSKTSLIAKERPSTTKKPTSFFISSHNEQEEPVQEEGEQEEGKVDASQPIHRKNSSSWTISLDGEAPMEDPYVIPSPLAASPGHKAWSKKASADSVHSTPSTSRLSSRVQLHRRFSPQKAPSSTDGSKGEEESVQKEHSSEGEDLINDIGSTIQPLDLQSDHVQDAEEDSEARDDVAQLRRQDATPSPVIGGTSTITTASPAYTEKTSMLDAASAQYAHLSPARTLAESTREEETEGARQSILHEVPTSATANTMDRRIIDIVDDFLKRDWAYEAQHYAPSSQPSDNSTASQYQ